MKGPLPLDALVPDGIGVIIDWDVMVPGDSVFFPCINTREAKKQAKAEFDHRGWEMEARACIENDIWGLRIWRTA